jgi:hypothetical protein
MTVYWMVWDAAAHWITGRLLAEGALPSLSRLRTGGITAAARPPAPNCQTPPSLATLFTGPLGDSRSGFGYAELGAEPVWETIGRRGLRTAAVHVPWVLDAPSAPGWLDGAIEAYSRRLCRAAADDITGGAFETRVGPHRLRAVPEGPRITVRSDCDRVTVAGSWVPLRLPGGSGLWLRQAEPDGHRTLLRTGAWSPRVAGRNGALTTALARVPAFAGEGLGSLYRTARLGQRLADGGDGSAEDLFLSSLRCVHDHFASAAAATLAGHDADLVVIYLPVTDDACHELLGWCDPRSQCHRPDIAAAVWRRLRTCFTWSDEVLGRVLDRAGPGDTVVVSADHGMAGVSRTLYPNAALVRAGLAAASGGRLDPGRSTVLYHTANNGSLWVNDEARSGGWVPAAECQEFLARADAVIRAEAQGLLLPGMILADDGRSAQLLFDPDCQPSADLPADGRAVAAAVKTGSHVTNQGDDRLLAVLAAAGPGLPAGRDLGMLDNAWPPELVLDHVTTTLGRGKCAAI